MDVPRIIWLNGSFISEDQAYISPFDHGITVGDGCFETMVSYRLTPFAFSRHYQRLVNSVAGLGLTNIPSQKELFNASCKLIEMNKLDDPIRIRITLTGGKSGLGSDRDAAPLTALIAVTQAPSLGEFCKVQTVPYTRNERSAVVGLKTISYADNVVALDEAHKKGASEAIFGNTKDLISEGTGSNIFWVENGEVYTPPLKEVGALAGCTRALAIKLCGELGIPCHEVLEPMSKLSTITEAFLTSTTREIQPIVAIDSRPLEIGETTRALRQAYKDMVAVDLDP